MKHTIAKDDWLNAVQCLTRAWHRLQADPKPPTDANRFRMEQGQEVSELARKLYPTGIFVRKTEGKTTAEVTQELIKIPATETLFEATFQSDPLIAKADLLTRTDDGWHVQEVKSSFSDTKDIQNHVADLAYTVMVLRRAGLSVTKASLVLLSRDYLYGDNPERLFEIMDQTAEVDKLSAIFDAFYEVYVPGMLGDTAPDAKLISACRKCSFFDNTCLGKGLNHTVLELPNLHQTKFKRLSEDNIVDLRELPGDLELSERQRVARDSALSGKPFFGDNFRKSLDSIDWPCYYLDFETVMTALPLYEGQGCHQQVLTQFSLHHRDAIDGETHHQEFLADADKECARELAEALIDALGNRGSIVVYGSFESTRIKSLRERFPDLNSPLEAILNRLVDLLGIIRANVYHPEFRGSFSVKSVLPALVDLSYEDLAVADGDTAITMFARMARGEIPAKQIEKVRHNLREYCKRDTFAMVQIHDYLQAHT